MTIESSLNELKAVLEKIDSKELETYLRSKNLDDYGKLDIIVSYVYKRLDKETGLIPVLTAILNWCPPEDIPNPGMSQRIKDANTKRLTDIASIEKMTEEIRNVSATLSEARKTEEELEKEKKELQSLTTTDAEVKERIAELRAAIDEIKSSSIQIDKDSQSDMGELFEAKDCLENYEKFLAACVKARKMTVASDNGRISESDDAKAIHEFLLVKWFLNDRKPNYNSDLFAKKYEELMKDIVATSDKAKQFFRDYMDATDKLTELPE